jgi:hypothetical protein
LEVFRRENELEKDSLVFPSTTSFHTSNTTALLVEEDDEEEALLLEAAPVEEHQQEEEMIRKQDKDVPPSSLKDYQQQHELPHQIQTTAKVTRPPSSPPSENKSAPVLSKTSFTAASDIEKQGVRCSSSPSSKRSNHDSEDELMALKQKCAELTSLMEILAKQLVQVTSPNRKSRKELELQQAQDLEQQLQHKIALMEQQHKRHSQALRSDIQYLESQLQHCYNMTSIPPNNSTSSSMTTTSSSSSIESMASSNNGTNDNDSPCSQKKKKAVRFSLSHPPVAPTATTSVTTMTNTTCSIEEIEEEDDDDNKDDEDVVEDDDAMMRMNQYKLDTLRHLRERKRLVNPSYSLSTYSYMEANVLVPRLSLMTPPRAASAANGSLVLGSSPRGVSPFHHHYYSSRMASTMIMETNQSFPALVAAIAHLDMDSSSSS